MKRVRWARWLMGVLVIFGGYVVVRMATVPIDFELEQTYEIPEAEELKMKFGETGRWAVAIDGEKILGNGDEIVQPTASTTKMILALAVMTMKPFEVGEKGETITITQEMFERYNWYIENNGSNTAVALGEEISEYDALASVLLASSNNMADGLAIWAFGSLENYREYAMEMLASYGLTQTKLGPDASGYNAGTVSTASELAKIANLVLRQPVLAEIVGTKKTVVPVAGEITNTNKLLGSLGIVGVKTGYIGEESGYCLVLGYLVEEHFVTLAVLGAATRAKSFAMSEEIIKDLQTQLVPREIISKGQKVGYYKSWWMGEVPVLAEDSVRMLNWQGAKQSVELMENELKVTIAGEEKMVKVKETEALRKPNLWERFLYAFGWQK